MRIRILDLPGTFLIFFTRLYFGDDPEPDPYFNNIESKKAFESEKFCLLVLVDILPLGSGSKKPKCSGIGY